LNKAFFIKKMLKMFKFTLPTTGAYLKFILMVLICENKGSPKKKTKTNKQVFKKRR